MNAKPKTELNRCVFIQKRKSVNGALETREILQDIVGNFPSPAARQCTFLRIIY